MGFPVDSPLRTGDGKWRVQGPYLQTRAWVPILCVQQTESKSEAPARWLCFSEGRNRNARGSNRNGVGVQDRSASQGADAGVGIGMGWGGRVSFNWIEKIQDFHFMFFEMYWSHIQDFQDLIRRVSRFSWHASFPLFSTFRCLDSPKEIFTKIGLDVSWILWSSSAENKGAGIKNNGFRESVSFRYSRTSWQSKLPDVWKTESAIHWCKFEQGLYGLHRGK